MRRERRWLFAGLAALALLVVLGRAAAQVYVDYAWYDALGAAAVWRVKALHVVALKAASLALVGAFVSVNLYGVRQSVPRVVLPRRVGGRVIGEEVS